jgi:alpha-N-arabinofuranosidase
VESVAVSEEEEGTVTVFAVNRLPEAQELTICLDDFPQAQVIEHVVLENADKDAINTADHPMAVCPHAGGQSAAEGCIVRSMLPGLSWNMVRLKVR